MVVDKGPLTETPLATTIVAPPVTIVVEGAAAVEDVSPLFSVIEEAAAGVDVASLEPELAAVGRGPLNEVPTTIVVVPKLIVFPPAVLAVVEA